ncbi:hypothetical protein FRB96_000684 [Tulasnella sp. 330]|nr:hypothetical protein FRB96_000684 [Tulasnella sp. 330]
MDDHAVFGDADDFWVKYDELANKYDEDMIARLNGNLDVLLIFAGLFSAVDTAFIVVALTALSAGPADQTNYLLQLLLTNGTNSGLGSSELVAPSFVPTRSAVRQNCFFFASLGCSLLAAAGAVLAKQWLQYYERTGQTGPIRQQAIRRTEKFLGAKSWGLAQAVDTLPALILISLAFFSAGLVDYLWQVDQDVAITVSALTAVGFLGYGFTIVAGAISKVCPFQTSTSKSLRKLYRRGQELPSDAMEILGRPRSLVSLAVANSRSLPPAFNNAVRNLLRRAWDRILDGDPRVILEVSQRATLSVYASLGISVTATSSIFKFALGLLNRMALSSKRDTRYQHDDWIYTRSAMWMAETAPEEDNILTIAKNLPFILDFESMQLIASSRAFSLILLRFRSTLLALRNDRTGPNRVANAVTMARAVAHVALADPGDTADALSRVFHHMGSLDWLIDLCGPELPESEELMIFLISISSAFRWKASDQALERVSPIKEAFRKGLDRSDRNGAEATTHLHHCILMAPSNARSWGETHDQVDEIGKTLLLDAPKVDIAFVACGSRALSETLRASPDYPEVSQNMAEQSFERARSAWATRTENALADGLIDVLDALSTYFSRARHSARPHPVYSPLLLCQRQLLIHGKAWYSSDDLSQQNQKSHSTPSFQRLHSALNRNIQECIDMDYASIYPPIEEYATCQNVAVEFLQALLLTPASQWHDVESHDLETTARLARKIAWGRDKLSEAILYRYFVHVQRSLYATDSTDQRHAKLSRDRRIGPVLVSALRLYRKLYPTITYADLWPIFENYLRSLATGHVERGYVVQVIDWIPSATTRDAGIYEAQTPTVSRALDPRRPLTPSLEPSRDDSLAHEVEETVVGLCREWNLSQYNLAGSCMLWLAESIRARERWAVLVDATSVIRLFVDVVNKQDQPVGDDAPSEDGMWGSVDTKSAGVLFLRAWQVSLIASNEVTVTAPPADSDSLGWTGSTTLSAFALWLRTLDNGGKISINEKGDDVIYIEALVEMELILLFIARARVENSEMAAHLELDKVGERLAQMPDSPTAFFTIRTRNSRSGRITERTQDQSSSTPQPSENENVTTVPHVPRRRPPPMHFASGQQLLPPIHHESAHSRRKMDVGLQTAVGRTESST